MTFDTATAPVPDAENAITDSEQIAKISTLKSRLITARKFAGEAENAYGEKYSELIEVLDATRNAWEAQNSLLIAEHERTKTYLEDTEKEIRQEVINYCRANDTKKFDEHLSMRVAIKLEYEPDVATEWAKTNAPIMLVVDGKQFESLVKTTTKVKGKETLAEQIDRSRKELEVKGLGFVGLDPAYSAVIATDLSELVSSEGRVAAAE